MPRRKKAQIGRPVDLKKREAFAIWWSVPKSQRNPKTIDAWCTENDVVPSTTYRWRQDPEFRSMVLNLRMEVVDEHLPDVIKSLTEKAKEGELHHAKFLMEILGDYLPKSEVHHTMEGGGGFELSEELIEFIASEMLEHEDMVQMDETVLG